MFTVQVAGTGPFQYQWRKNNVNLDGATGAGYHIANAQTNDSATYSVTVSNLVGGVSASAVLTVVAASASLERWTQQNGGTTSELVGTA